MGEIASSEVLPWARYDDMFAGWASKLIGQSLSIRAVLVNRHCHTTNIPSVFTSSSRQFALINQHFSFTES